MYFSSQLSVDPSQMTKIQTIPPSHMFKKMLFKMKLAAGEGEIEHETFTAVAVLQQLYKAFRAVSVTNVVKLSKDDTVFYEDEEGREDDLKEALDNFAAEMDPVEAVAFKQLHLVVEHDTELFKFFMDIAINKSHDVGEYPIQIQIDGLLKLFKMDEGRDTAALLDTMAATMGDNNAYNAFVQTQRAAFDEFVDNLKLEIGRIIGVDDIQVETEAVILRPNRRVDDAFTWTRPTQVTSWGRAGRSRRKTRYNTPVFTGYYGMDDYLFYVWLWAEYCHDHEIFLEDVVVFGEDGGFVAEFDEGVNAAEEACFDVDEAGIADEMQTNTDAYDDDVNLDGDLSDKNSIGVDDITEDTLRNVSPEPVADYAASAPAESSSWWGGDSGSSDTSSWSGGDSGSSCGSSCSSGGSSCSSCSSCS